MQKIIQSIFQTLIITIGLQAQAGDLFNFSINYNSDSNTSNYIDNYNEQEESRVANYYNVNDITIDSLGSTNQQIGHIFEDLANDAHINSRDLPAIISQLGSNYTPQEQQNFISTIQRLSGKNESQSIVQVAPHLSDIKPTFLSKEENLLFNTARLKISNSMSKAITNCKKEKCSLSSLHVSKNLLNKVINSSLNNTINTSHLNRWGEDTSFTQESEESIKRFIENIDKKNLNQAIKELELQEKVQTRIESIAAEWDIKFERVENKSPETPIEQYANDLIDLKRCTLKKEACDSINSLSTHNDFKDEYKQLESLYKTSNYIGSSSVDIEYKESAFDFLSLSADSLIQGDIESSQKIEKVALSIIDIGLGLLPVAGIGKDIYELVTGKNLVTDDKLSEFDRTLALVGILSLGSSHYISAAGKVLIKFKNITKSVFSNGVTIVNSARKLGFSKASQLGEFIKSSTGRTWSKIKATGQAVTEKGYKLFKKDVPINNPFPDSGVYARVVDKKFADKIKKGELPLSRPNAGNEAFVTALDDIKDISNPTAYAKRLSLYTDKAGTQLVDTTEYTVLKFKFKPDIQQSIRTPIELLEKRNFGFIPGGRTIGNAREWLISNDAFQRGLIEFVD